MDSWILAVLVLILFELMWIGSRLRPATEQSELPKELLGELKEIRQELTWFKNDTFAGHLLREVDKFAGDLFKEIKENREHLESEIIQIREELTWFKDDKFGGRLLKEINDLEHEIAAISQSLRNIDASLDDLKEVAWNLQESQEDISSC